MQENTRVELAEVAAMITDHRPLGRYRCAVIGADRGHAIAAFLAIESGHEHDGVLPAKAAQEDSIAFLYPGQGSQAAGMGEELYECSDIYRERVGELVL